MSTLQMQSLFLPNVTKRDFSKKKISTVLFILVTLLKNLAVWPSKTHLCDSKAFYLSMFVFQVTLTLHSKGHKNT